jgi:AAA+ superfamily predicted ATPase
MLNSENIKQFENCDSRLNVPRINTEEIINWTFFTFYGKLWHDEVKGDDNKGYRNLNSKLVKVNLSFDFIKFCKESSHKLDLLYKEAFEYDDNIIHGASAVSIKDSKFLFSTSKIKDNYEQFKTFSFIWFRGQDLNLINSLFKEYEIWLAKKKIKEKTITKFSLYGSQEEKLENSFHWNDIVLTKKLKSEIKCSVENFLASKDFYIKNKIPWKRGMIFSGEPGVGKTSVIKTLISNYSFAVITNDNCQIESIVNMFTAVEDNSKLGLPSLIFIEDLDSVMNSQELDVSKFLNLLDGIKEVNGLLIIATTNDVNKLQDSIMDRPSRFDTIYHFPLPDQKLCNEYLNKLFGKNLSKENYNKIIKFAVDNKFSYAHLKEIYVSSFFQAMKNNRKNPISKDIEAVLGMWELEIPQNSVDTAKYFG